MKNDIDHHNENAVSHDPEYRRRCRDAMSAYADLEIETWKLVCAEAATNPVSSLERSSRQGGRR